VPASSKPTAAEPASGTGRDDPATMAELLLARVDDDNLGLRFEDAGWSWRQVVAESVIRGGLARRLRREGPFHVGVLLDNVPEYLFWLGGAALAGATVVGVNPTRRGEELARDVRFTDCQLVVTDDAGAALLSGLDLDLEPARVLSIDGAGYGAHLEAAAGGVAGATGPDVSAHTLYLLLFTSGTTAAPKAVRCTQGRLAQIARRSSEGYGFRADDVCYCPMPLFHGNAIMALWAPALWAGASMALSRRFSASGFLPDLRRYGATRFTYVGKALSYVLATPERPDDADNSLRAGFGTEASAPDRARFERRFGCRLAEGYGSSEGGAAITVTPETPTGSLGLPFEDVAVHDPGTLTECPPARFDGAGRLLNAEEAIGEIVNRTGTQGFEGYYQNAEADRERSRNGWYWTGDLGYRDDRGFFYFAGRGGDWLRVDSENFAAAPVERILERLDDVTSAVVYAVPDPRSGDRVMTALELRDGRRFDPGAFADFLADQADLGTKWAPTFVRISPRLPVTATGKLTKPPLQRERWESDDPVYWRRDRGDGYRLLTAADRRQLRAEFAAHGRGVLLGPEPGVASADAVDAVDAVDAGGAGRRAPD
jgi:fatty-acyl-CoA synthase